jgi:hypothetical protein
MRRLLGCIPAVVLVAACSVADGPASPTALDGPVFSALPGSTPHIGIRSLDGSDPGWSPWFYPQWQTGIGEPLAADSIVESVVEAGDICAPNLRWVWDARSSCRRFRVSVPAEGRLQASLRWDVSSPGFDANLAGEVVLVAPDGRMAASAWQRAEVAVATPVEPGEYGALVISYVPVNQRFELGIELQ